MVAHYPFDGNSSDISGNNLNGSNTSVQWGGTLTGRSGQSLSLPGTDNKKVVVSHNNLLNLTEWTVSAWVYANNPDSGGVIIEKGDSPGANFRLAFNHSGGSPARQPYAFFEQSNGTDVKIAATGTNLQNQWASIVATRDSSSSDYTSTEQKRLLNHPSLCSEWTESIHWNGRRLQLFLRWKN